MQELLMGNEAIAVGALMAGVGVVCGYPGTPSTEVVETVARRNPGDVHVEWSVNEKAALEVAAGAAYCGVRAMVTMKQVGLNVASDPLMSLNYIGVKGGMVVFVADDPGPISSQTEQDTRHFGKYAKLPVLDPASPEEALTMVGEAFALSEAHGMPVILRATTRVCHSCASVEVGPFPPKKQGDGFQKGSNWVIFPRLAYNSKKRIEQREGTLSELFSNNPHNEIIGTGKLGIACGGISYAYAREALAGREDEVRILKIATPFPFPDALAEQFLDQVQRVLVLEELDPVIEDALLYLCGRTGRKADIRGKRTGDVANAGELSVMLAAEAAERVLGITCSVPVPYGADAPDLPTRPPVLCAGCPHRASFYAVKRAMAGKKAVFCGDIGCYTLGNAAPLDMTDTCLCMGADITIAQGLGWGGNGSTNFAFIGDSTFFASGMTGVVNAVYNQADIVLVVLDNSTTAMTGHQPHPGIGRTMMGTMSPPERIPELLRAMGVSPVVEADPLDLEAAVAAVQSVSDQPGVRAVIFKSPCIAITRGHTPLTVDKAACIGCQTCIRELGCPALRRSGKQVEIDGSLCTGCGLCTGVCPVHCIGGKLG